MQTFEIMNEVNPKYQQIVAKGKELFWKHGVKRVSIEEICREAQVSKMTFYKFFPNKKELAKEIIKVVIGKGVDDFNELVASDKSFTEKVQEMFFLKHEATKDISPEFINDLYKNPELGLHSELEALGQRSMAVFVQFLNDSKEKGFIREDVKIEFILVYQNNLTQMMDNPQLMSLYEKPEDFIMDAMNFLFYGIMPKREEK